VKCCRICNQGRLLTFHHSAALSLFAASPFLSFPSLLSLSPASPSPPSRLPLPSLTMLPSSQVNTNPFEIITQDQSRSTTPAPSPSPNASSPALSQDNAPPPSPSAEGQLSTDQPPSRTPSRSFSNTFVSSPLNPSLSLSVSEASLRLQRKCGPLSNCFRGLPGPRFSACFLTTWFHGLLAPRRDG
jgi:hypothetical protein